MPPEKFRAVAGGPFEDIARQLNELRRFAISIKPVSGRNIQCDDSGSYGVTVSQAKVKESVANATPPELFKVISVHGDFLLCRKAEFNPQSAGDPYEETSSTEYKIAKPFKLRASPFNGKTIDGISYGYTSAIERSSSRNNVIQTEVITPVYNVEGGGITGAANTNFDVIWAIDISDTPRTDKIYGAGDVADGFTGFVTAEWLDLNVDGRAWAVKSSISP